MCLESKSVLWTCIRAWEPVRAAWEKLSGSGRTSEVVDRFSQDLDIRVGGLWPHARWSWNWRRSDGSDLVLKLCNDLG